MVRATQHVEASGLGGLGLAAKRERIPISPHLIAEPERPHRLSLESNYWCETARHRPLEEVPDVPIGAQRGSSVVGASEVDGQASTRVAER